MKYDFSKYEFPMSTPDKLYLSEYEVHTLGDLLEQAREHFGVTSAMETLSFSIENIKITGCSCHYDASDYALYTVIERRFPKES